MRAQTKYVNGVRVLTSTPEKPAEPKKEVRLELPKKKDVQLMRTSAVNRLRFSPYAWAKYHWLRDRTNNEVAGFGISSRSDITYIEDVRLLKQTVSSASAEFNEEDIPRYLDDMVDEGYQPLECMRIWLHTHPGNSASPSGTDEATFKEAFGRADWAVMCILAQGGQIKAKVCLTGGEGHFRHAYEIPVGVDCTGAFEGVSREAVERWEEEYTKYVYVQHFHYAGVTRVEYPHPYSQFKQPDVQGIGGLESDEDVYEDLYGLNSWRDRVVDEAAFGADSSKGVESIDMVDFDITDDFPYHEFVVDTVHKEHIMFVLLEERWFAYPAGTAIELREGEAARCAKDLSDELPIAYGELSWDYAEGEATATSISDLNQSITFVSDMSFDSVYEMIIDWATDPSPEVATTQVEMDAKIAAADDAAEKLADQFMAELEAKQETDPSAETVHDGQPICEGQPDARGI